MNSKKFKLEKNHIIVGGAVLVIFLLVLIFGTVISNSKDGAKFKREYEAYNGEKTSNGNEYQTLKIPKKNKVKYSSIDEALEILKNGDGLIYFGFPNCPWCRGMLPTLLDVVDCSCVDNLLYVDMTDKRDEYKVEDGEVKRVKEAEDNYYKLLERLSGELEDYVVTDEDGIEYETGEKRLYVPFVVAVKDGMIVGIYDGITLNDNQSPYDELTESQKSEMNVIFTNMIQEMTNVTEQNVCDEHC